MSTAWRTTSAPSLRLPSSGSEADAARACANCGAALGGPFCAGCGQRDAPLDPTARELAVDAAQEVLGVDGKLLTTARLLFRPGHLTVDYLAGHRVAHVGPVRIYLVCSALLFALLALQPRDGRRPRPDEFRIFGGATVVVHMDDTTAARLEHNQHTTLSERAVLRMRAAIRAGPEHHAELEQRTLNAIPQAFFLMVPAYAGVLWLIAPRPRRHYPAHLCFALHVHAFAFAALASVLGARLLVGALVRSPGAGTPAATGALNSATDVLLGTFCLAVLAYTVAAHRRVYRETWPGAVARVSGSTVLYLVLLGVAISVLLLGVLFVG